MTKMNELETIGAIGAIGFTVIMCTFAGTIIALHQWLRSRELGEQDDEDD